MLAKLALRNVRRSAKDYLVYFFTMTVVVALMFAFNSLLFSKEIRDSFQGVEIMEVMLGLATFFIVLIIAWLINYMMRFILEKRSREFGIYLLLGMEKRQIAKLYMRESVLLGTGAFLAGLVFGVLVQQILMAILYSMVLSDYSINIEFNRRCLIMTASCYAGCYLLAVFRCKGKLRRMNIHSFMNAARQNEEIKESHEELKQWLFPISILFLVLFGVWLFYGKEWGSHTMLLFLVGLVLVIYLFYMGLSAWIVIYVRRGGNAIYKAQTLFLLRQFASKIKTMRFTMGTLTALFVLAFLGCSVAMMFNFYENRMLPDKMPFDIHIHSAYVEEDFADQLSIIENNVPVKEAYAYHIYENQTTQINVWLYTHLQVFGDMYKKADGSPDLQALLEERNLAYCSYDTYMSLTDYNHLRGMLGLDAIALSNEEYAIHIKDRVFRETGDFSDQLVIETSDRRLRFAGYHTEPFSQDGHNGGDYVIVVPDAVTAKMRPFYSELAVQLDGKTPEHLRKLLDDAVNIDADTMLGGTECVGSESILVWGSDNLVRDNLLLEMKCMLSSVIFPLTYIGLVFLCVALTVLSVQQLSDSAKYKFRYQVLRQIGMGTREIAGLILRQLFVFYLCPALFAAVISGIIIGFVGGKFNLYAGTTTPVVVYFGISLVLFFGVYSVYFVVTYVGFLRNVESDK